MKQLFFLFLFLQLSLHAQFQINGIIKDSVSKKALPFATITTENGFATIADVDGKFNLLLNTKPKILSVSYFGYEAKTISLSELKNYFTIYLSPKTTTLKDVTISNINRANVIISKVIQAKTNNNPQKKLSSFQFKSYNKLLLTANPDSIKGKIDTVFVNAVTSEKIKKIDSSDYKFKRIISKQHLFLTENVSQFQFEKPFLKETVLATKMAGFKEPIYKLLGFGLQSFSIYDDHYELFETKYKSPISDNALQKYRYKILDTPFIENRQVIVLYFKNKSARGLEGLLYIDKENFAIAKAVMRIRGVLDITGIHEFTYLTEEKVWFPILKKIKIVKGKSKEPTTILGGRIEFAAENDDTTTKTKASDFTYFTSEMQVFDLEVNNPLKLKKSYVAIEVNDNAN